MKRRLLFSIIFLSGLALFFITNEAEASSQTLYRVYNPNSGEHFYTKNSSERNTLIRVGWHDEGIAWETPSSGKTVYRLYNPNAGDHHFTMDTKEYNYLGKVGWRKEGEAFKSVDINSKDKPIGIPVYRAYNPNAKAGTHNFTINQNEQKYLIKVGWRDEKVAFYANHESNDYFKVTVVHKSGTKVLKEFSIKIKEGVNYIARAEKFSGYDLVGADTVEIKKIASNKKVVFTYNKVNKDKLQSTLQTVGQLKEDDYTPISWEKLMREKEAAKATMDQKEATQKEVDNRLSSLNEAVKELVKRAETQALQNLYQKATGMGPQHFADYETYIKFHNAYSDAYNKLSDLNITQKAVNDALNELQQMVDLAKADAPQELLNQLNTLYETGLTKNKEDYTPSTWNELSKYLDEAKNILAGERPIEETAKAALDHLQGALDNLIAKADKTDLTALYESSKDLGTADFSSYDDYLAYHAAITDAWNILPDEDVSQQRVNECYAVLQTALSKRTT
ncbi:hypothetical protein [Enterococcus sp. AZ196]|uniref:hypothetical protein n=1 Tax=Enterococcus sp. AZ196 TaxID=2774659 RepID=UPI003D291590